MGSSVQSGVISTQYTVHGTQYVARAYEMRSSSPSPLGRTLPLLGPAPPQAPTDAQLVRRRGGSGRCPPPRPPPSPPRPEVPLA
eukprot:387700-Prorocentrum_minimum.AAC.1